MNPRKLYLLLCLIIILPCCVEQTEDSASTTTTSTTQVSSTAPTSTTTTSTTISYRNVDSIDDCMLYEDQTIRDDCLLNLGIKFRDEGVCELIERLSAKKLCIATIQGEKTGSSVIKGYVMNKTTTLAVKGVKVYAVSQTTGEEEAVDTTDSQGFYSMEVPSGDTYNVTASIGDKEYTQRQYARNGWTHELWFKIP